MLYNYDTSNDANIKMLYNYQLIIIVHNYILTVYANTIPLQLCSPLMSGLKNYFIPFLI